MTDYERKAVAARAPDLHVFDGTMELKGHWLSLTRLMIAGSSIRAWTSWDEERGMCGRPSLLRLNIGRGQAGIRHSRKLFDLRPKMNCLVDQEGCKARIRR